jgi:hypothetical protein
MKHFMMAAVAVTLTVTTAFAADTGVSVSIGQPGFYGQINIGDYPVPQVFNRQPVIIQRGHVNSTPVYLRVPPGQRKKWSRYCRQYNACGERVYFVQDNWYKQEYVPRYQAQHRDRHDKQGDVRQNNKQGDRGNSGEKARDNGRNNGNDNGKGPHGRD